MNKMINHTRSYMSLLGLLLVLTTCKKHDPDTKPGRISFSDTYAIIIPDSTDALNIDKIYKLTEWDRLQELKLKGNDGTDLSNQYIPEGIYNLSRDFFMLSLSLKNTEPKIYETYLVRLSDGNAFEIPADYRPLNPDGTGDYDINAVKKANDMIFYSVNKKQLNKLTITGKDHFKFAAIDISGITFNNYDADYSGHAMVGNSYIISPDTIFTSALYEPDNSIIVKAYNSGFNIVKLKEGSIQVFRVWFNNYDLQEDTIATLTQDYTGWQFVTNLSFPDYNQTIVVFNKGILCITKNHVKLLDMALFNMSSILQADQSRTNYYLFGSTYEDKKMFLRMNPAYDPPAFSQLMVPDSYNILNLHVSGDNTVSFMAAKVSDQTEFYRYIRQSGGFKEVLNYQKIKTKQIYTVR